MSVLPWRELILGANQMGIMPAQFWALSVFEWRALMGEAQGLNGTRLSELIRDFPDGE
jgi:Phage tail assembly chaperone protein, TAC